MAKKGQASPTVPADSVSVMNVHAPAELSPTSLLTDENAASPTAGSTFTTACFHCGTPCPTPRTPQPTEKSFCCNACQTVHELLSSNGLSHFYDLGRFQGVRLTETPDTTQYQHLDDPQVATRLLDFSDGTTTSKITWATPTMHCIACVWLLENLYKLHPGVGQVRVNFPRKETQITFNPSLISLSHLASLLASIGYPPELRLADLGNPSKNQRHNPALRKLQLQLGLAGFAFGNIMLLSIPSYFGLDAFSGPSFRHLAGILSILLSLPVITYSALDYWQSALRCLRHKHLTIELPIAAGIAAIWLQSLYEILSHTGEGYLDSLAGLLFFLLTGRLFQTKTFDRLTFDRDYRSFFPLSATRSQNGREETVSLDQLSTGDVLIVRHGQLIPADARLTQGIAIIDYSFVTGESQPVEKPVGEILYAGGMQTGGSIEVRLIKPVSQSYLASLWSQDAFQKPKAVELGLDTLTNRYSRTFTWIVLAIALGAAGFWAWRDPSRSLKSFTSVLIVACPCALAIAAPFTWGAAQRFLARRKIFIKNGHVLEALAEIDTIALDKTGTLTLAQQGDVQFEGLPLTQEECTGIATLTAQSIHPISSRVHHHVRTLSLSSSPPQATPHSGFQEHAGRGLEASLLHHHYQMGSWSWLRSLHIPIPDHLSEYSGSTHLAIDGIYRGTFVLHSALRPQITELLPKLREHYRLALLTGDQAHQTQLLIQWIGHAGSVRFKQSPLDKLEFVRAAQQDGARVMMVGDGLNDAGALRQAHVGVAVVEQLGTFAPASDVILPGTEVSQLDRLLTFATHTTRVVRLSFRISALYNIIGLAIAAQGILSPIVCAILMPVSSITIITFTCGMVEWKGRSTFPNPITTPDASQDRNRKEVSRGWKENPA